MYTMSSTNIFPDDLQLSSDLSSSTCQNIARILTSTLAYHEARPRIATVLDESGIYGRRNRRTVEFVAALSDALTLYNTTIPQEQPHLVYVLASIRDYQRDHKNRYIQYVARRILLHDLYIHCPPPDVSEGYDRTSDTSERYCRCTTCTRENTIPSSQNLDNSGSPDDSSSSGTSVSTDASGWMHGIYFPRGQFRGSRFDPECN